MTCPACGDTRSQDVERALAYTLKQCQSCTLVYSDPMTAGDLAFYQGHIVYSKPSLEQALFHKQSAANPKNRALLKDLPKGARTLDIGCGYGAFVSLAHDQGFDAHGIDFNADQIATGREAFKLENRLHAGRLEDHSSLFKPAAYDMVSMFEVIEHVEAPRQLVERAHALLKPGGLLAMSCPNEDRWKPAGRIFVDYPPHHLTRWSQAAMQGLLTKLGFEQVQFKVDSSVRDLLWTYAVNRSAEQKMKTAPPPDQTIAATEPAGRQVQRNIKMSLFKVSGLAFAPLDGILRLANIGTMGMRTYARKKRA